MSNSHPRMVRERRTVRAMVRIYCQAHHQAQDALCAQCRELSEYAFARLERCPFQESKTTCAKCPVHCYTPVMRERIRGVMRYAGPRMLYWHPWLALQHLIDGFRAKPMRSVSEVNQP